MHRRSHPRVRPFRLLAALALGGVLLPACTGSGGGDDAKEDRTRQPAGWDTGIAHPVAEDVNPDPKIVEVHLEAAETEVELTPGVVTTVWAYNGMIPGPTIEANVGDRLIVHLTNKLPMPTTIHWHGVEISAVMDGSNISQLPIPMGATFTYDFELLRAATYWYHPHIETLEQVERGLAGALVVRDPEGDRALGLPEDELVLMLDDVLLDGDGQFVAPDPLDPVLRGQQRINGREGDLLLVNGKEVPTVRVRSGVPVRLRMINHANAMFFRVSLPNRSFQIGGDGGLLEAPLRVSPIELLEGSAEIPVTIGGYKLVSDPNPNVGTLLVPAERAELHFTPIGGPGEEQLVEWHDFERGRHVVERGEDGELVVKRAADDGRRDPRPLLKMVFTDDSDPNAAIVQPPAALRTIARVDPTGAEVLPITFGHSALGSDGDITFFAQLVDGEGVPFWDLTAETALHVTLGETYVWEVTNVAAGDHVFHPHGWFFQHLDTEFVDLDNPLNNRVERANHLEDKDTFRVPRRLGAKDRSWTISRFVSRFGDEGRERLAEAYGKTPTEERSGGWLAHCHILEHGDRGMMTFFQTRYPRAGAARRPAAPAGADPRALLPGPVRLQGDG